MQPEWSIPLKRSREKTGEHGVLIVNLKLTASMSYTRPYPGPYGAMTKKILVVEDLADIRKMMKIMVELYGYEVIEARDGTEAVEQARTHNPSLVLMDLAMPLMNGADAARAIKSTESCANIPIIAVTAYRNMDQEALDAGCEQVIHKPVDFLKLKTLLAEHAI